MPRWSAPFLLLLLTLLGLGACASRSRGPMMQKWAAPESEAAYDYEEAPRMSRSAGAMAPAPAPAVSSMMADGLNPDAGSGATRAPEPTPGGDAAPVGSPRMVHYEGWARLRVTQLDGAVDALVGIAAEVGGRVESVSRTRVVLRVPVESFRAVFPRLLALGDVLDQSLRAQDVTDAFTAVELRLRTATAARDRLIALLAKATEEEEKIVLLKEIQKLEEEIDGLQRQSSTLSDLASMSRVTIELVPRDAVVSRRSDTESAALAWIRELSPFRDGAWASGKRLTLDVPAGMVSLDKRRYTAEAADGARIRGARIPNEPQGSADFWLDAIRQRLEAEFEEVTVERIGAFAVVRLVSVGDEPYVYVVAVRPRGAWLDLVEIYYPSKEAEGRYRDAVQAVLLGGAV